MRVLRHELLMGIALGVTLGAIGFLRGLTTPQSLLDSVEHFKDEIEIRLPPGTVLAASESAIDIPAGAQLVGTKTERPAELTLPPGGSATHVESTADFELYRFPPNANIRYPTKIRWSLACVIAQSVAAICLWGTLVGSMLPLLFRHLGFDPGYASSPFVATFVDVTGILIYFSIAHMWLL
jgi:magnesium transporter